MWVLFICTRESAIQISRADKGMSIITQKQILVQGRTQKNAESRGIKMDGNLINAGPTPANTNPEPTQAKAEPATNTASEPTPEPQLSVEEQLQQALLENEKLKRAQEKAASEAADYKKKYNATLTDAQKAAQEKAEKEAERQEQFDRLLKENTVNKLSKNFLKLGYPEDKAEEAANAQYEGDTETLFRIQSEIQQVLIKQKEAEWIKNRPQVATGAGNGGEEDFFLKGFNSVKHF